MKYVNTNYGSKITIILNEDPYLYKLMQDIADKIVDNDPDANIMISDVLEIFYYGADIGYAYVDDVNVFPLIAPDYDHDTINMLIPSPALTQLYDLAQAGAMLEKYTNEHQLHVEIFSDEDFQDMYESLVCDESEEGDPDEHEEDESSMQTLVLNNDCNNTDNIVKTNEAAVEQYLHVDKIKQFYRLKKGSEMFKYKKFAKAFYRLGDNFFMDVKPNVVLQDDTIHLQNVDTTYAVKIPLKDIRLR